MSVTEEQAQNLEAQGANPEIWKRFSVPPGRIMLVRDKVKEAAVEFEDITGAVKSIYLTDERRSINQMFEPWATVLMIGAARPTEYGTLIEPPDVKEGDRVLIAPTGGRDVEIGDGEQKMSVTVVPFEAVLLIDHGDGAL